jgi:hypothetical protein
MHVSDVFNCAFAGSLRACVQKSHDGSAMTSAGLKAEAVDLRDGILELPHYSQLSLIRDDVNDIINFTGTA